MYNDSSTDLPIGIPVQSIAFDLIISMDSGMRSNGMRSNAPNILVHIRNLMSMFEMEVAAFNKNFWKTMSISILDGKFKIKYSNIQTLFFIIMMNYTTMKKKKDEIPFYEIT